MTILNRLIHSKSILWLLLAVPAVPFVNNWVGSELYLPEILYRTGVISVQLLVLTLVITPIAKLLKMQGVGMGVSRWFLQRRRNFGVASFAYAFLHMLIYLLENNDWQIIWREAVSIEYGSGWLAMIVMLPLAMTSNNFSMKLLGKRWKKLQQFAYFVAAATFLHWLSFGFFINLGFQWLAILLVCKLLQIWVNFRPKNKMAKNLKKSAY